MAVRRIALSGGKILMSETEEKFEERRSTDRGLRRLHRQVVREIGGRKSGNWDFFVPEFRVGAAYLKNSPEWLRKGEVLWKTRHKLVVKISLPASAGGGEIVCKSVVPKRSFFLGWSTAWREAVNYRLLARAGFPMAELLGVGEERRFFCLKRAFLITRFAAGCCDGRAFEPGAGGDSPADRDEFVRSSLRQLAGMHDLQYFHKGFKPYNILWSKPSEEARSMRLVLIDVATGRLVSRLRLAGCVRCDLGDFLEQLGLTREQIADYVRFYRECRQRFRPAEKLAEQLMTLLAKRERRGKGKRRM